MTELNVMSLNLIITISSHIFVQILFCDRPLRILSYIFEIRYNINKIQNSRISYRYSFYVSILNLLSLNSMQKYSKITDVREAITKGYARIPFTNVFTVYNGASSLHNTKSG